MYVPNLFTFEQKLFIPDSTCPRPIGFHTIGVFRADFRRWQLLESVIQEKCAAVTHFAIFFKHFMKTNAIFRTLYDDTVHLIKARKKERDPTQSYNKSPYTNRKILKKQMCSTIEIKVRLQLKVFISIHKSLVLRFVYIISIKVSFHYTQTINPSGGESNERLYASRSQWILDRNAMLISKYLRCATPVPNKASGSCCNTSTPSAEHCLPLRCIL